MPETVLSFVPEFHEKHFPREVETKMRLLSLLPAGLAACLCLAGCLSADRDPNAPAKIGVILPLTGEYGEYGQRILRGIRCGRVALERQPGASLLPELLVGDSRGLPDDVRSAALQMIGQGAAILLVGYTSREALAVKSIAQEYEIPVITPGGSSDRITENNPYMFRASFSDRQQARAAASYARHTRRFERMAVMLNLDENAVYSRDLGRQTAQAFADFGGTVVSAVGFRETDKDFSGPVKMLLKEQPDVVFVPAYPACAGKIVKALRDAGFKGLALGGDGWYGDDFLAHCGPQVGDAAFSSVYAPDAPAIRGNGFRQLYAELHQTSPTVHEALGFDSLLLAATVTRGTANSGEVLEKFSRMREFDGALGRVLMKNNGELSRPTCITRVVRSPEGKLKFKFETIIRPERDGDSVFPSAE